jgi:hypothetical protein
MISKSKKEQRHIFLITGLAYQDVEHKPHLTCTQNLDWPNLNRFKCLKK